MNPVHKFPQTCAEKDLTADYTGQNAGCYINHGMLLQKHGRQNNKEGKKGNKKPNSLFIANFVRGQHGSTGTDRIIHMNTGKYIG